jgi:monooxygenase
VFTQDVLWFRLRLPAGDPVPRAVRVFRAGGNPVMAYPSAPDRLQFGWTLPHGGYRTLAAEGLEHVKEQLRAAVPDYAGAIDAEVRSFKDISLLDVFSGVAEEWARDGLLLIGDAAHTHSAIGAQGINLALQDAAAAHPVLLDALRRDDTSAAVLDEYVQARRPDIAKMMRIQVMQSGAMLDTGRVASFIRPKMAAVVSRTPLYRMMLRQIAFGNRGIGVREDLFAAPVSR